MEDDFSRPTTVEWSASIQTLSWLWKRSTHAQMPVFINSYVTFLCIWLLWDCVFTWYILDIFLFCSIVAWFMCLSPIPVQSNTSRTPLTFAFSSSSRNISSIVRLHRTSLTGPNLGSFRSCVPFENNYNKKSIVVVCQHCEVFLGRADCFLTRPQVEDSVTAPGYRG